MNSSAPIRPSVPPWAVFLVCLVWTVYLSVAWVSDVRVPTTMLQRVSWDEYQFLPHIHVLQDHLRAGHYRAFFSSTEDFGYGDLFWQAYAAASLPVANLFPTDSPWPVIWLRYLTLGLQLGCLLVSLSLLRYLTAEEDRPFARRVFVPLIMVMPGLMLLYKPFSSDYLANFLALTGLLFAHRALTGTRTAMTARAALAALLMGASLATKAYNVLLLPIFVLCIFGYRWPGKARSPQILAAALAGIAGFLVANTSLLATGFTPFVQKFRRLSAVMNADNYLHVIKPAGLGHRFVAWWSNPNADSLVGIDTTGVAREFFPVLSLSLLVVLAGIALWRSRREASSPALHPGGVFLVGGFAAIVLTILTTNRVWTWYLLCPVFVFALGLASSVALLRGRTWRYFAGAVVALHCGLLLPGWTEKLRAFLRERDHAIAEFQAYYHDVVVPYRPIIRQLPSGAVMANDRAPIEPLLSRLYWSDELRTFLTPETQLISVREPTEADRQEFLRHGFTERRFSEGYSVFLASGLTHPR